MFKKNYSYIFLLSIIFFSGCALVSHKPLSMQDSQSIKTIYINPEIKKPKEMYEFASGTQVGFAFGAVGGLASALINEQAAVPTQKFAEKNSIDIQKIIYQRWRKQLNNQSKFKLATKPSDTVLTTDISRYGISIPHGFSTDYVPILTLNAKLVRNNQTIWQESGLVLPLTSGMPRYKMDAIRKDPKKLYAMWDKAAEKIINAMLIDMSK